MAGTRVRASSQGWVPRGPVGSMASAEVGVFMSQEKNATNQGFFFFSGKLAVKCLFTSLSLSEQFPHLLHTTATHPASLTASAGVSARL